MEHQTLEVYALSTYSPRMTPIAARKYFKFAALVLPFIFSFHAALCAGAGVVNGDFSGGDSGFTTSYSFIPIGTSSTTPGTFGIRTNSQDFNPGYDLFHDHTSGSGNMMLVDGTANTVVWQESVPVTPNTNYTFTAWVTPANSANPSHLTFSINGVQVGATVALTNTPGVWQPFSAGWNSGSSTTAVLSITDLDDVSLGNDFALDDISFDAGSGTPVAANIYTAVEVNWASQANISYQVQYRTNANSGSWLDFGAPIQGTGTNNSVFDSTRGQPHKFYRVIIAP